MTIQISAQVPGTFDLLCPKPFENLVFGRRSRKGQILYTATASGGAVAVAVAVAQGGFSPALPDYKIGEIQGTRTIP